MKWSLYLLFCLILFILLIFKNYDNFKGGRGGRWIGGSGAGNRKFDIIDVVGIFLVIFFLFINKNKK